MGTTMAPSYANFFMGKLEKQIIQSSPQKPFSWSPFIDDIDMKWTDSKENLLFIKCKIIMLQYQCEQLEKNLPLMILKRPFDPRPANTVIM
jgi:hypothetical protein